MKFYIQNNLLSREYLKGTRESVEHLPHQFIYTVPFSDEIYSEFPIEGSEVIPYGSTHFIYLGLRKFSWKGLYFDLANFDYEMAINNRNDMLNNHLTMSAKHAVIFMKENDPNEEWFVRPVKDLKQFTGTVIKAKEWYDWLSDAVECVSQGSYRIDESDRLVIAPPQKIDAEWRWFIVGGKVISGSQYKLNGKWEKERIVDRQLICEAQKLADKWLPNSCCVMDVASVRGKKKVIEFNCINSSGIYSVDQKKVFDSLFEFSNL